MVARRALAATAAVAVALIPVGLAITFITTYNSSHPDDPNIGGGMLFFASLSAAFFIGRWVYRRLAGGVPTRS